MWCEGGCRTYIWGQPATATPAATSKRWQTQVSGEELKASSKFFFPTQTNLMTGGDFFSAVVPSLNAVLSTVGQRWDIPSHCGWGSHQDELPTRDPPSGQDRYRPRGVWTSSWFGDVRHTVAAGAQPSVWHPEGRASHVGWRTALPDCTTYRHRWEWAGCAQALGGFILNTFFILNPSENVQPVSHCNGLSHRDKLWRFTVKH